MDDKTVLLEYCPDTDMPPLYRQEADIILILRQTLSDVHLIHSWLYYCLWCTFNTQLALLLSSL